MALILISIVFFVLNLVLCSTSCLAISLHGYNLVIESGLRVVIGIPFLSQWWCGVSSRDISTAPLSFGYICEESYLSIHDPKSSAISSFRV